MKETILVIGAFYGASAVMLGAFGAHAFKKILSEERLSSFETGVRYQMYHALLLLVIGLLAHTDSGNYDKVAWCVIIGTALFSFSIYFLSFKDYWKINLRFLGPVTPIGGLFLVAGWVLLLLKFI
ncbi:DUF423 domain-containing protein [Olivibacter sitiensis]|uniref:DUF423 domain-containing protein n=1 Tax=Olivibacter sitiensis TaxID=376470 RepID=UPI000413AC12|nr:DUF423 domain-containing protein [Olivibacter sitiensis]